MFRAVLRGVVILLLLGLAALVATAAVLGASGQQGSRPSSNYTGPPVVLPAHVPATHGSNMPSALRSPAIAPRPHASNRVTTP
jgi:hypothetical protein